MKYFTYFLAFFFTYTWLNAQTPGSLDLTYNPADVGYNLGDGANNSISATAIQADGKILIGGSQISWNAATNRRISRLNADGTLDNSFNFPSAGNTGPNSSVNAVQIQPDGKILIGGAFTSFSGVATRYLARLNVDGTKDVTFNPGTASSSAVTNMVLQPDGKILIGGNFTTFNGTARSRIARVNNDGTLDLTFDPGIGASNAVGAIALQPDGKILVGGNFATFNGAPHVRILRLNTDGTIDNTFSAGNGANYYVRAIALQPDGKILIGGDFTTIDGNSISRIARLNADGTLDATFVVGTGMDDRVSSIAVQPDGKIVCGGLFTQYNGVQHTRIIRLNANGSIDNTFLNGNGLDNELSVILLQNDNRILIGGSFNYMDRTARGKFARLQTNGVVDTTFNGGSAANDLVQSIAIQPDAKILLGGEFTLLNASIRHHITRVNPDGSNDPGFMVGYGMDSAVYSISLQPDGKIIAGGAFTQYQSIGRNRIVRILANGVLDNTFTPGTAANGRVQATMVQPDGKIVLGGAFTSFNGNSTPGIARLNANGSVDAGFTTGTGANGIVYALAIQPDGKIIAGGSFSLYNGVAANNIVRLNTDGTLDATFLSGTGMNAPVYALSIQPDGKIIAAGDFTTYNAASRTRVARLNTDGTLDAVFNTAAGPNARVNAIDIQSNGKIVLGGDFTNYNGSSRLRITRVNSDGTTDAGFIPGTAAPATVWACKLQANGKIMLGGAFVSIAGTGRNRTARLWGDCIAPSIVATTPASRCDSGLITLSATPSGGNVLWYDQPTGGTLLFTGNDYSPSLSSTTTFYAEPNDGFCGSGPRIAVTGTVQFSSSFSQSFTLCAGQSVTVGPSTYNATGNYTDVVPAANGCDSVISTQLTILPANTTSQSFTLCAGQSITVGGNTYNSSGVYSDVFQAANGCDSTVTTNLTVNPAITFTQNPTICTGQSFTVGGNTYTTSGTYIDVLTAANNCDSTVTTNLLVTSPSAISQSPVICAGQSITVGPNTYSIAGTYTDTLQNAGGCDSIVTTNLTVNSPSSFSQSITLCDGQSVSVGGNIYTQSGTYTDVIPASNGCDSTVTTNLTVLTHSITTQSFNLCAGQSISVAGNVYSTSGNYSDTLVAANGCDSIIETSLTVAPVIDVSYTVFGTQIFANNTTAQSYQWLNCSTSFSSIPGATGGVYAPSVSGSYAVAVTEGACTDTSACETMVITGLANALPSTISLYPNPNHGAFTVQLPNNTDEALIRVVDLQGRVISEVRNYGPAIRMELGELGVGMYLVEVILGGERLSAKIWIE